MAFKALNFLPSGDIPQADRIVTAKQTATGGDSVPQDEHPEHIGSGIRVPAAGVILGVGGIDVAQNQSGIVGAVETHLEEIVVEADLCRI